MRFIADVTHVLFDFFGTLVSYSDSRTAQGYRRTHALLASMNIGLNYEEFLVEWSVEASKFDLLTAESRREFSMDEVCTAFLLRFLDHVPSASEISALRLSYMAEWNTGVGYPAETYDTVPLVASRYRLAIITNTHDRDLVPAHLEAMNLAAYFDAVVTSVDVGWRKPHPAIYERAFRDLGISPAQAIYVGDSYEPDYVGSLSLGMLPFLIDPASRHDVPAWNRLRSIGELPQRLGMAGGKVGG